MTFRFMFFYEHDISADDVGFLRVLLIFHNAMFQFDPLQKVLGAASRRSRTPKNNSTFATLRTACSERLKDPGRA